MVPKKFTSYRGQGESGLQRFPGKIFKEKMKIFFRENAIASNKKPVWIEIECHVYLLSDVPPGRRPGTNARILINQGFF